MSNVPTVDRNRYLKKPENMAEFKDLPTWVRVAAVMHDVIGLTWAEAAQRCGKKNGGSLQQYASRSPAFKKWREELKTVSEDPIRISEIVLRSTALNITADYLAAYEKAVEVGDYNAVAKMSQDIYDRLGIVRKKEQKQEFKIELSLGSGGVSLLEPPKVEATHEEIAEAEFSVEDV